tara:strand:+ start:15371 stop:15880 length:510 start_codon:yes stop_codon:yes gene_type:complete
MKIEVLKLQQYEGKNFSVTKSQGQARMYFGDNYIDNEDYYADYMLGQCECPLSELFDGVGTNSILICGLGMGLVPLLANTLYKKVDVIDYDQELIDYAINREIIPVGVGLFNANAYTYTPSQKYDVILIDLWWDANDITDEEKDTLLSNYENYLNENGKIILPVTFNSL